MMCALRIMAPARTHRRVAGASGYPAPSSAVAPSCRWHVWNARCRPGVRTQCRDVPSAQNVPFWRPVVCGVRARRPCFGWLCVPLIASTDGSVNFVARGSRFRWKCGEDCSPGSRRVFHYPPPTLVCSMSVGSRPRTLQDDGEWSFRDDDGAPACCASRCRRSFCSDHGLLRGHGVQRSLWCWRELCGCRGRWFCVAR